MNLRTIILPLVIAAAAAGCAGSDTTVAADADVADTETTIAEAADAEASDEGASDPEASDPEASDPEAGTADAESGAEGVPATTVDEPSGPLGAGSGAIGTIEVTITHPNAESFTYTVGCTGDAFPVSPEVSGVDGKTACDLLANTDVVDRLVNGFPADQVCPEIYGGPDEAIIVGQVDGQDIDAVISRVNGCEIDSWDRMTGLLPLPLGPIE